MKITYLTLIIVFLSACNNSPKNIENTISHTFSHPEIKDKFHISIVGNSIIEGNVIFTIKDYNDIEIFKEEFPARYLIGYELDNEASTFEKEKFIKKRIIEFFKEDNFSSPAIHADDEFDEDYSKRKIWKIIIEDQSTIGFFYKIGEEDLRWIAYSKKLKKVVMYYNCC